MVKEEKKEPENKEPDVISFDDKQYLIKDLSPELALLFNMLLRINKEVEEAAYIMQRIQGSQSHYIKEIKKKIVDDGLNPIEENE